MQRAKNVVSDIPGLVDFAIGQVKFLEEFKLPKNFEIHLLIKTFLGLVEMMFGLVNVSFSLPERQAVKMIFFAPCYLVEVRGSSVHSLRLLVSVRVKTRSIVINFRIPGHLLASL